MPYIPPDVVAKAKEMDLLTYLQNYEPQELVRLSSNTYCTHEHDSLKISNGKWCWYSRGIGGRSALDYLIKVKEIPFTEAVEIITGQVAIRPPQPVKEGGVLLRRSAFFFCIWERKEEKGEKNRQKKSAAMSARRAF